MTSGRQPADLGQVTVELHCHTYRSDDSLMLPGALLEVCRERGIDRIAITDHNTIEGAVEAQQLDPRRVIVGEEILTTQGELLAYFVHEEVPPGLTPLEAIQRLRAQGAFISVSHPLDALRTGAWELADLKAILPHVDALEVLNARTVGDRADQRASALAAEAGVLGTAGSDAHAYPEVGRVTMSMPPFGDALQFRGSLRQATIRGKRSSPLVHLYSRYAVIRKRLGWRPA